MEDLIHESDELLESAEISNLESLGIHRRVMFSTALSAIVLSSCDKINKVFDTIEQSFTDSGSQQAMTEPKQVSKKPELEPEPEPEPEISKDPNRPEFLDKNSVKLEGLALLISNNDIFDRYIFNAVTGNNSFTNTYQIQKGYEFVIDGEIYKFPYHAFLFKPFDKTSNVLLPERLGKAAGDRTLVDFFNGVTRYMADNPKDIAAIKQIIVTTFEFALRINLNPDYIEIIPNKNGRIKSIKYKDPQKNRLIVTTTIATDIKVDSLNKEKTHVVDDVEKKWRLLDNDRNLYFPPSVMIDQGIAIPHSALKEQKTVKYKHKFKSQGETISLNFAFPIQGVLDEQDKLFKQGRPQYFQVDRYTKTSNPGWYVLDDDFFVNELAAIIIERFTTKRQKMQAILDFAHSYNYVPDTYGEAPRSPMVSLISKGGDCEDSSILVAALARAVGIDCVFTYFEGHAAVACDIGGKGTAFTWNGNKYEWVETTGGNEGMVTLTQYKDSYGRIIKTKRTARGWRIGEKPPNIGPIQYVSRIDGDKLVRFEQ